MVIEAPVQAERRKRRKDEKIRRREKRSRRRGNSKHIAVLSLILNNFISHVRKETRRCV